MKLIKTGLPTRSARSRMTRHFIAFYDRLRYAPLGSYAQLHAKGNIRKTGIKYIL